MTSKIVSIDYDVLADLLLASHSCTTVEMSQEYPTLYKEYTASQDKARQALRWGEYAKKT